MSFYKIKNKMFFDKLLFTRHLEAGEEIIFAAHKHWSSAYSILFKAAFFGIAAPWLLYGIFPPIFWIALAWSILGYLKFMHAVVDWYSDAVIFSNESVIHVEWNGFFHRSSSRINYLDIEEIAYVVQGFWGTIFNYGELSISTASNTVSLSYTSDPKNAEAILNKIKTEKSDKKRLSDSNKLRDLISDMVSTNI